MFRATRLLSCKGESGDCRTRPCPRAVASQHQRTMPYLHVRPCALGSDRLPAGFFCPLSHSSTTTTTTTPNSTHTTHDTRRHDTTTALHTLHRDGQRTTTTQQKTPCHRMPPPHEIGTRIPSCITGGASVRERKVRGNNNTEHCTLNQQLTR